MSPEQAARPTIRDLLAKAIDDLDAGKEVDLIELERECEAAAIPRHLAPGDELVERAEAALEGVTPGKPCQFHPSYCKEAEGAPLSEWDSSHDLSVILPDGERYKIGHFRHSADAGFDQFARQWVPEAAARISALTATVAKIEMDFTAISAIADRFKSDCQAAEAEAATLRDRLARMEGAATKIRDLIKYDLDPKSCEITASEDGEFVVYDHVSAALTDGGSNG